MNKEQIKMNKNLPKNNEKILICVQVCNLFFFDHAFLWEKKLINLLCQI